MASLVTNGEKFSPGPDGTARVSTHANQVQHMPFSDAISQLKKLPPADFLLTSETGERRKFPCSKISVVPSDQPNPCAELASKWQGTVFGGSGRKPMCLAHVWTNADQKCMASLVPGGDIYSERADGGAAVSTHRGQVVHMLLDEAIKLPTIPSNEIRLVSEAGETKTFACPMISVVQPS